MSTFDSTKKALPEIIKQITEGKMQLPDFQRGWVWDDEHVRSLLVSIARSFPVGAVMLLDTGGDVKFVESKPSASVFRVGRVHASEANADTRPQIPPIYPALLQRAVRHRALP
jgi:hypothetical protein